MNNTFEFVGKIFHCKETEKFKPFQTVKFDGGWSKKTGRFNMVCGTNRHLLDVSELVNPDENKAIVYTFSKGGTSDSGEKIKGESLKIPFKDRLKQSEIDKVAEFKKFVVDTEMSGRRFKLEKAIDKFKDGTITDEQIQELGINNIEECQTELEKSKSKKHEFISAYDYIDYLNKLVNSDKIKNMVFRITGTYEITGYNEEKKTFYKSLIPQRIYRIADDSEQISQINFGIIFNKEALDTNTYNETKKYHVNGYISQYLSNYKKNVFMPILLTIDGNGNEKDIKKAEGFKKKFTFPETDAEYREIGVVCNYLDGAQKVEITEDMLTDEQKENIEYGLITLDDIRKEIGGDVFGDNVTDFVITGLARNWSSGAKDTAYIDKDLSSPSIDSDTEEDIFDDDEI